MEFPKKTVRTFAAIAVGCVVLYWALQNLKLVGGFLSAAFSLVWPFILGGAIAFILSVPMRAIEKKLPKKLRRTRRAASLCLTLLAVAGVLAVVLLLLIPQVSATANNIGKLLPGFWAQAQQLLADLLIKYPVLQEWLADAAQMDWQKLLDTVVEWARNGGMALVGNAANAATGILSGMVNFSIALVFAIYVLLQKEKLGCQVKMLLYAWVPAPRADRVLEVASLTNKTFSNFLSGQCLEACILGGMFAVGMVICRMPYVSLVSVLIAVTALIPIFGAFIGCFVGALLILVQNPIQAFWFVVLFLCLQQIEGNLVYPKVVGNSVGLPSIWVLVAVTVGGSTMGVAGMLVMIPMCSVLYSLLRTATRDKLREKGVEKYKYTGQPPAPGGAARKKP